MSERIVWNEDGKRYFETGVRRGVLYPKTGANGSYAAGVAWSGLTAVNESPEGAESNKQYADDQEYVNIISREQFKGSIEAFWYPKEFEQCDGAVEIAPGVYITAQTRKPFGLCYRTAIGSDTAGDDAGYKLHIVYGATVTPTEKNHETEGENIEPGTFSWDFDTLAQDVPGHKPTAHLIINSLFVNDAAKMAALEAALYGVSADEYDTTKTYNKGDYCEHSDKYYVCKTNGTTGAWSDTAWTEITDPGPHILTPAQVADIVGPFPGE